ncbi:3-oxoacyl-[acyl-carrier protein] reductase [Klebsiella pneumoniae ISC21]|nr:3-oxoacyl-[acyl-carrier protein] reductase [Klebsiella pneumoniae ISC21]
MARELGPDNVRVNCITPGLIQTDITAGKLTDDMTANILAGIPMNRLGDAIDIARARCSSAAIFPPTPPASPWTLTAAC